MTGDGGCMCGRGERGWGVAGGAQECRDEAMTRQRQGSTATSRGREVCMPVCVPRGERKGQGYEHARGRPCCVVEPHVCAPVVRHPVQLWVAESLPAPACPRAHACVRKCSPHVCERTGGLRALRARDGGGLQPRWPSAAATAGAASHGKGLPLCAIATAAPSADGACGACCPRAPHRYSGSWPHQNPMSSVAHPEKPTTGVRMAGTHARTHAHTHSLTHTKAFGAGHAPPPLGPRGTGCTCAARCRWWRLPRQRLVRGPKGACPTFVHRPPFIPPGSPLR